MNPTSEWNKEALLNSPCFAPLSPIISRLKTDGFPTLQDCNDLLAASASTIAVHSGQLLRFVPQEYGKLPFEAQYEPRCFIKGEVPTRANNWHDLLNALVWLTFPKAKAAINARHYQALTQEHHFGKSGRRGTVRDTSTLLDESGVIVACANGKQAELLRNFQWKELFWQQRTQLAFCMGFFLFGHGLYEKSLHPYIGMTGQGLILPVEEAFFTWPVARQLSHLDELLADYLASTAHCRSTRTNTCSTARRTGIGKKDNENAEYFDNTNYFRTGRNGYSTN